MTNCGIEGQTLALLRQEVRRFPAAYLKVDEETIIIFAGMGWGGRIVARRARITWITNIQTGDREHIQTKTWNRFDDQAVLSCTCPVGTMPARWLHGGWLWQFGEELSRQNQANSVPGGHTRIGLTAAPEPSLRKLSKGAGVWGACWPQGGCGHMIRMREPTPVLFFCSDHKCGMLIRWLKTHRNHIGSPFQISGPRLLDSDADADSV